MEKIDLSFRILELVTTFFTPILVIIVGLLLSRKTERIKLDALKEKEWQVKWAENFYTQAYDFNKHVSIVISTLFELQSYTDREKIELLKNKISSSNAKLSHINWDIGNYAQFSDSYGDKVIETQEKIMKSITELLTNGSGDLETIRKIQLKYNQAIREAHNEILNME